MTLTGADEFGDPCRGCRYNWTEPAAQIQRTHRLVHDALDALTVADFNRSGAGLSWSVGEYICHIGDNERIWAERFAAIDAQTRSVSIAPFDQDLLAAARNYNLIGYASGMWSMRRGFDDFTTTSHEAARRSGILRHPERGALPILDAMRTVVHDCHHHLHDIRRILADDRSVTNDLKHPH